MFNIVRPQEIPESLTLAAPRYNAPDVLNALEVMCFGKCYICELKDPVSVDVEHFDANGDRYDWNNIFLACHRCNSNIKSSRYNNLLDPCNPRSDVVRAIRHVPPRSPGGSIEIEAMLNSPQAEQTAELLSKVFNLADTGNRAITLGYLRKRVFAVTCKFQKEIWDYCNPDSRPSVREEAFDQIVHYLRCEQEFSAFLRWIILDDEDLRVDFEAYIV